MHQRVLPPSWALLLRPAARAGSLMQIKMYMLRGQFTQNHSPTVLALSNRACLGLFPMWNFWWHQQRSPGEESAATNPTPPAWCCPKAAASWVPWYKILKKRLKNTFLTKKSTQSRVLPLPFRLFFIIKYFSVLSRKKSCVLTFKKSWFLTFIYFS